MTKKDLENEYIKEKGFVNFTEFNPVNDNDYTRFLERKLLDITLEKQMEPKVKSNLKVIDLSKYKNSD